MDEPSGSTRVRIAERVAVRETGRETQARSAGAPQGWSAEQAINPSFSASYKKGPFNGAFLIAAAEAPGFHNPSLDRVRMMYRSAIR